MTSFATEVRAVDDDVVVITKQRSFWIFKQPRTSVIPRHGLGIQFRWTTDDPEKLELLHLQVAALMSETAYSDLRTVLNLKLNVDNELQCIGRDLEVDAPSIPLPEQLEEILPYLKAII